MSNKATVHAEKTNPPPTAHAIYLSSVIRLRPRRGCQVLWLPFKRLARHLAPQRSHRLVARRKPGAAKDVVAEVPWQATALLGFVCAGGVTAPRRWLRADLRRGGAVRCRTCFGLAQDVGMACAELALFLSWRVRLGSIQNVVQRRRVPFAVDVGLASRTRRG